MASKCITAELFLFQSDSEIINAKGGIGLLELQTCLTKDT